MAKGMRDELKYNTYAKHSALNMCMCILTNIRYTIHVRMITERKRDLTQMRYNLNKDTQSLYSRQYLLQYD